jgi:hypothetical protein
MGASGQAGTAASGRLGTIDERHIDARRRPRVLTGGTALPGRARSLLERSTKALLDAPNSPHEAPQRGVRGDRR